MNIEPRVYARYEFGVEKVADLKGEDKAERVQTTGANTKSRIGRQGDRSKSHRSGAARAIARLRFEEFGIRGLYRCTITADRAINGH